MAMAATVLATLGAARIAAWRPAAGVAVIAVALGLWLWRRRRPEPWTSIALAIVGTAGIFVGDGPLTVPLAGVAILVLVLDHGVRAGLVTLAAVGIAGIVVLGSLVGKPWIEAIVQAAVASAVIGFFVALASVLRDSEDDRRRLGEVNERLSRSLAAQKDLVLAEERARAATELHDGLGHQLTVIRMNLELAQRLRDKDPDQAWEEIAFTQGLAGEALAQMRMWVRALNPVPIGSLRGSEAFDAIADAFRGTGLEVTVDVQGLDELSDDQLLFCYRLVQEGLTNTLRHGRATAARLEIDHGTAGTDLILIDDGAGSDDPPQQGFGLRSLTERVEALGGRLSAHGIAPGFRLAAWLPRAGEI